VRPQVRLGASGWREQFTNAMLVSGGEDDDNEEGGEPSKPGISAYLLHFFALPWKLIVACVPPPAIANGYPCFFCALIVIGAMTALIGDLANLLGCSMGVRPDVVAFTFVALGTSLPDTFASRSAALGDPTADAAIGNVTGSNAVNVFLGLGISWFIGAVYWSGMGITEQWIGRYPDIVANWEARYGTTLVPGMSVGLAVPAGSLGFSVIVFCVCAVICIATLGVRRCLFDAELGSQMRWPTFVFFIGLWFVYGFLSAFTSYEFINPGI